MTVKLYDYQLEAIERAKGQKNVAFYHDCGLGKTFTGAECAVRMGNIYNIVVCQKSKIKDWTNHFKKHYPAFLVIDGSLKDFNIKKIEESVKKQPVVLIINYDLIFRRNVDLPIKYTLILDESSLIQNYQTKRTRGIMKLKPANIILLSGTPTGGKYEKLVTQMRLLGDKISMTEMLEKYCIYTEMKVPGLYFTVKNVVAYKNVVDLKIRLEKLGCQFLMAEDVINLPEKNFIEYKIPTDPNYRRFRKVKVCEIDGTEFIPENPLHAMTIERVLCSTVNKEKVIAFSDLLDSTEDRLIVFYNYVREIDRLKSIAKQAERPISILNGTTKDLNAYENDSNSVTFIQYQAGSMGLNLQKANKICFFTPPLKVEYWLQAQERIHRIGQERPCFYYVFQCENSIETKILRALKKGQDYTEKLFLKDF